eukprot:scaffold4032_cov83-Cylindrotheca_fusiformis.AAC.2
MGHRITSTAQKNHVVEPDVFLTQQDRQSYGKDQFGVLNDPTRLGGARLQQFQDHPVGAALIVSLGSGNTPFITVVANPTITPVDPTDPDDHGAPYWDEAFEPGTFQRVLPPGVTRTHSCLVSMGWQTREGGLKPKDELVSVAKPVILTPDTQLGELAPELEASVSDPSRGSPIFKILLWPELCSPPVGLFWPTTTTFQEFCDSLKGNTLYTAFLDCCGPDSMVANWFTRVNRDYSSFVVHLADAVPLWHALPAPSHPDGRGVLKSDMVTPFLYQFDRFLWALHCDRVQRSIGACTNRGEKLVFSWYLHHGAKLYPQELCDSKAKATHQAFFGHLFRPTGSGWPDPARNLLAGFDALDRETQVPSEFHEFHPVRVPITRDDSFQPTRLAFASVVHAEQNQVPVPVVHTQTAAPSPAPGPAATAPPNPVPFVTPAGGGTGGLVGNTAVAHHQPGSPAVFSISDTSVQPLPALPPPVMGQHVPPAVGHHQQHPVTPAQPPIRPQNPDPFLQPQPRSLQGPGGPQGVHWDWYGDFDRSVAAATSVQLAHAYWADSSASTGPESSSHDDDSAATARFRPMVGPDIGFRTAAVRAPFFRFPSANGNNYPARRSCYPSCSSTGVATVPATNSFCSSADLQSFL